MKTNQVSKSPKEKYRHKIPAWVKEYKQVCKHHWVKHHWVKHRTSIEYYKGRCTCQQPIAAQRGQNVGVGNDGAGVKGSTIKQKFTGTSIQKRQPALNGRQMFVVFHHVQYLHKRKFWTNMCQQCSRGRCTHNIKHNIYIKKCANNYNDSRYTSPSCSYVDPESCQHNQPAPHSCHVLRSAMYWSTHGSAWRGARIHWWALNSTI